LNLYLEIKNKNSLKLDQIYFDQYYFEGKYSISHILPSRELDEIYEFLNHKLSDLFNIYKRTNSTKYLIK